MESRKESLTPRGAERWSLRPHPVWDESNLRTTCAALHVHRLSSRIATGRLARPANQADTAYAGASRSGAKLETGWTATRVAVLAVRTNVDEVASQTSDISSSDGSVKASFS